MIPAQHAGTVHVKSENGILPAAPDKFCSISYNKSEIVEVMAAVVKSQITVKVTNGLYVVNPPVNVD